MSGIVGGFSCLVPFAEEKYLDRTVFEGTDFLIHIPPNWLGLRRQSKVVARGSSVNMKIDTPNEMAVINSCPALAKLPAGLFQVRATRIARQRALFEPLPRCFLLRQYQDDTL